MASFCLVKQKVDEFKRALREREIDPFKMADMSSEERRNLLTKYVGEENAHQVNSLFESKLLLKNKKAGYISWAKRVSGITPEVRRDMLSKIERLDTVLNPEEEGQFLEDLAAKRLGIEVTEEEARTISQLSDRIGTLREKANKDGIFESESDRYQYGVAKVAIEKYVNDLKLDAKSTSFSEEPLKKITEGVKELPGMMKSIVASLDNSFWGRQGIKTLLDMRTAPIWTKNFVKSFGDIGRELAGIDAIDAIKSDIYSRPNALNGKYEAGNYGLTVLSEEAFPSSLPERIPLLGRLFKASEAAYNGAALRLRADLADRLIRIAEKQGINTLDKRQAEGMGRLVTSLTGRGSLGKADVLSKEINTLFFSIKFLKSNFDTLTGHQFDSKATQFTKREAAKNLLSMAVTLTSVLTIAKMIDPESVEDDVRSKNFGKIKIFGHWTDITGGMAGLLTLASRLMPTYHDGKRSFWKKNSDGTYVDLGTGKFGVPNVMDEIQSFLEGKLSPFAGILRDIWKGENYQGDKVTPETAAKQVLTPISLQNFEQLKNDPQSGSVLGSMILDGLGLSVSTFSQSQKKDWGDSTSQELISFKNKVGEQKFNEANDRYNRDYDKWLTRTKETQTYKNLSEEGKKNLEDRAKKQIQKNTLHAYGFEYKKPKKNRAEEREDKKINKLIDRLATF